VQEIVLSGRFTGRPDQRRAIVDLARSMYAPSRAEPGCSSYACFAQADHPDAFLFFEEWSDQAALDAHFASPHFAGFMERFPTLIEGSPTITLYTAALVSDAEPAPPAAPIVLAGQFAAKPERRTDLIALSTAMLAPSRSEDGCISYDFLEDVGAAGRFLFFERWRNKATLDAHFATPGFAAFGRAFPDFIDGAASIRLFAVAAERTL
jgi:quinol monooxygenase YgiN